MSQKNISWHLHLSAQCPVKARIRYAIRRTRDERTGGKQFKWGEILSFMKKMGKFNSEPIQRDDREIEVDGVDG